MAINQMWLKDPVLVGTAQAIYEAKKADAWGNWASQYRGTWPVDHKALRLALHQETDPGIEFAFVQAKAAIDYLS